MLRRSLGAALLTLLIACGDDPKPAAPIVQSFTGSPLILAEGEATQLSWSVLGAASITISSTTGINLLENSDQLEGSASTGPLQRSTSFLLKAQNDVGETFSTVFVRVRIIKNAIIDSFTADPTEILEGDSTTLTWRTTDAVGIDINTSDGQSVLSDDEPNGSFMVSPTETTTYVLSARGDGQDATEQVTVTVLDGRPQILTFQAEPSPIFEGQTTRIRWVVDRADAIVIVDEPGTVLFEGSDRSGNVEVSPLQNTRYTLTATNSFGSVNETFTLVVSDPGIAAIQEFDAAPNPVGLGSQTTLSWRAQNATELQILEDGMQVFTTTTAQLMSGQFDATPSNETTTYTLVALNPASTASVAQTVYAHPAPQITAFSVLPSTFDGMTTARVIWNVENISLLDLFANGQPVMGFPVASSTTGAVDDAGMFDVVITESTFFQLVATSAGGQITATGASINGVVEVEPNNTFGQATAVPGDGRDAVGTLDPVGDEDWYSVQVPAGGNVRAQTVGAGGCAVDTELTLFGTDGMTQLATDDNSGEGNCSLIDPVTELAAQNLAAGTYYVRVTIAAGAVPPTGDYVLSIIARGQGCGNSILEGGEICDDGNLLPGDGCDATCALEGTPEDEPRGNELPTQPGVLVATADMRFFGAINPAGDVDHYGVVIPQGFHLEAFLTVGGLTDCPPPGATGPRGILTLVAPDGSTELAVNTDGAPSNNCGRIAIDTTLEAFSMSAGTYYVRVSEEGDDAEIPLYFLHIRIVSPGCSNLLVEPGEECDDGNITNGDGCSGLCTYEINPALIQPPGGTTNLNLTTPEAFGVVRVQLTQNGQSINATAADPGLATCNLVDSAIALRTLTYDLLGSTSGGGPMGAAGECAALLAPADVFATDLAAGTYHIFVSNEGLSTGAVQVGINIVNPGCANGIRETRAGEQCDDGNLVNGDGCSDMCVLEGGMIPEMEPNDNQSTANPTGLVGVGSFTVGGMTDPSGDDDVFSLVVPAGQNLRFSARTYTTANMPSSCDIALTDTRIFLELQGTEATAPGMGEIAFNDDIDNANNIWCSGVSNILLTPGTYYLRVQGWNDSQITTYFMDMTLTP